MDFSRAIRVADLNDYIAPSQDCVVALNGAKLRPSETSEEVQLQPRKAGSAAGTGSLAPGGEAVKVSLHDCLACSGCITSAETVLLQQQSAEEFLTRLADPNTAVVVTVSPQSRASLAAYYGLSPTQALARLSGWFKALGVRAVWDLNTARDLVLLEEGAEFLDRYRAVRSGSNGHNASFEASASPNGSLPLMASSCPGWVCYAEKTQGAGVLPYLSTTRSPQAAMGGLVKSVVAAEWGVPAESVYHVTVMPCYDKKLEASRDELTAAAPGPEPRRIPEVDCCLTSGEVLTLLQQHPAPGGHGAALADGGAAECAPDALLPSLPPEAQLYGMAHTSSSGGYADFVYRTAARELFGMHVPEGPLPWRTLRNADFQELVLAPPGGSVVSGSELRFARVYGFRNIQTLLRQTKSGRCAYHYVEVMACPSGCLNGGGQLKPRPGITPSELLEQLEVLYTHADIATRAPSDNPTVQLLYSKWLGGRPGAAQAKALLHTSFRMREKSVSLATVSNW